MAFIPVLVSVSSLRRTPLIGMGPTLIQHNLILTNYICKHYLEIGSHSEVWVDMEFGGTVQPSAVAWW